MATLIKCKKDLYNGGKCFSKGKVYEIGRNISQVSALMDIQIVNDLNEPHIIGSWWRDFEIAEEEEQ